MTNREYAKENGYFQKCFDAAFNKGVENEENKLKPTKRQASKFLLGKGKAYRMIHKLRR